MTPTRDGGIVIAFASYRSFRGFPTSRFTVLGVDASVCVRWRTSFRRALVGAIAPVREGADSIVIASDRPRRTAGLRLNTLSASTGRVRRREDLSAPAPLGGREPTLVSDRRGDLALVLSIPGRALGGRLVKLSRGAHAKRWSSRVIASPSTGVAAVNARPDGRMVLAYPRRGRLWVRTGTVAGRLGSPIAAGRLAGNFRSAAVALAQDGAIAAAWQSGTYSRPWRLRAAVRRVGSRGFAHAAQLGFAAGDNGTLFDGPAPALRIGANGRVTVGFYAPTVTTAGAVQVMCVQSTAAGHFARANPFTTDRPASYGGFAPTLLGRTVSAAMMLAIPSPDELGRTLVAVGSGCRARSSQLLEPLAGGPVQAAVDARDRVWLLTQSQPTVSSRRPLMLTVINP